MVDRGLILRKFADLEEYLGQIKQFSGTNLETYASDWKLQRIIERTLQIMVELTVDIANHIISDKRLRPPTSYADIFDVLFEAGIIDEPLRQVMKRMAKFRNIIVHAYDRVDHAIVMEILYNHLDDFLTFRDSIVSVLDH